MSMETENDLRKGHVLRSRRRRFSKESSGDLSIEELFPDDMGYDADIEHVFPDKYEEADSEPEMQQTPGKAFKTIDEDLAARMSRLSHERSVTSSPRPGDSERGRKRQSKDISTDMTEMKGTGLSDLEVMEVYEGQPESRPVKRRRKRSRKAEVRRHDMISSRVNSSTSSDRTDATGAALDEAEAMEIT